MSNKNNNLPSVFTIAVERISPKNGQLETVYTQGTIDPETGNKITLVEYLNKHYGWTKVQRGGQTEQTMTKKKVFKLIDLFTTADLERAQMVLENQKQSMEDIDEEYSSEETVTNTAKGAIIQSLDFGSASSDEPFNVEGLDFNSDRLEELGVSEEALTEIVLETIKIINQKATNSAERLEEKSEERMQQSA